MKITTHITKKGKEYRSFVWIGERPNRIKKRFSASTRTELKQKVRDAELHYEKSQRLSEGKDVNVFTFLREWLPHHALVNDLAPATVMGHRHHIYNNVKPSDIASVSISCINAKDVESLHTFLSSVRGLGARSIQSCHATLKTAFNWALKNNRVVSNPFILTQAPRPKKIDSSAIDRDRIISRDLWQRIYGQLRKDFDYACIRNDIYDKQRDMVTYQAILLSYITGCRPEEVLALRWKDIDFKRKLIIIRHAVTETKVGNIASTENISDLKSKMILKGTKTGKERQLTMGKILEFNLAIYKEFYDRYWDESKFRNEAETIFPTPYGDIMSVKVLSQRFKSLLKAVGDHTEHHHVLYDLRHTHASELIDQGADIVKISNRLGHSTPVTTLNFYSHLIPSKDAEMITQYEESLMEVLNANV